MILNALILLSDCIGIKGINRGIFGVKSDKKTEIEGLVKLLECRNPTPEPTGELDKIGGCWKLIYSTITVLGSKRTKLGLRDFVSLGDLLQQIDIAQVDKKEIDQFSFLVMTFLMCFFFN